MTRTSSNMPTEVRYGITINATDLVRSCPRTHSEADRALLPHATGTA